jgi:coenzyme F420-reducing hydrogenase beta subunit
MCLDVCPFQDHEMDEDTLAAACFGSLEGIQHSPEAGYHLASFAGCARGGFREAGASGGLASWFLATLLERGIVDQVICVRPQGDPSKLFEFAMFDTPDEVRGAAKSAYYPVELSGVLHHVLTHEGRYAIIALPCVAKALRLASDRIPRLRHRLQVVAGLVCGQTKSRCFAEYLVSNIGLESSKVNRLCFRSKHPARPASDFEMSAATREGKGGTARWSGGVYGETWLSGMFTPRACTLCDDIFAETADIVFMDAWLPEYTIDSRGTSLVLVRSRQALELIDQGQAVGELSLEPMPIGKVIASQAGVITAKRLGLRHRLWLASRKGLQLRKRVSPERPNWWRRMQADSKESLRVASLEAAASSGLSGGHWLQLVNARIRRSRARWHATQIPGQFCSYLKNRVRKGLHILLGARS